ncbi:MAG: fucose isomerase [bacterium]|nr:fucose isomerase [bacterium]
MKTRVTFGVIVGTRGFFPASLAVQGRKDILAKLAQLGYGAILPPEDATPHGAIETVADAKICAKLFREHAEEIDGILVLLPNFGDELGVVETITRAGLDVPIMVQASPDRVAQMDMARRRDAFCGKLSVCNNLYQRGFAITNTSRHTCDIASEEFTADLHYFATVCRIVKGISTARIGMIGQRPDPFNTVRFSEKLLEASGVHVCAVDLSEIIAAAQAMGETDAVRQRVAEIQAYGPVAPGTPSEHLLRQAKLSLAVEQWITANECDAAAMQCWASIQNNYGCAACLTMSMLGEKGTPCACETDVMGALSMYMLRLATGNAPGYLDWNNNYDDEENKCINIHCSNYPRSFIGHIREIGTLDILGAALGADRCFGAVKGNVAPGPMTFLKISTDDTRGVIKMYVGEGEFTNDPTDTVGGVAVCYVERLQELLDMLCQNGFEHHVAMVRGHVAKALAEAAEKYLGWEVFRHN